MTRTALTLTAAMVASTAIAEDLSLRIETRVYAEEPDKPVCKSVTLFSQGAVYDFREDRPTITIFRAGAAGKPGRFVLLDTKRKVRTEVTTDKLNRAMSSLQKWAAQSNDPFLRFAAAPEFVESFNKDSGELQLLGDQITYRVVTVAYEKPEAKLAVRRFLDSFTKLQTLLETSLPPEPRLRVNEALFRHGAMPVETKLYSGKQEEPSLRAEHLTVWMLSKSDQVRIDEAIDKMASFKEVSNQAYKGRAEVAAKK